MMDANGYPEEHELQKIREWPIKCREDSIGLIEYIRDRWAYADCGYFSFDGRLLRISTAGWSGNEDIMNALIDNRLFWFIHWRSTRRGGHYVFEIEKKNDNG